MEKIMLRISGCNGALLLDNPAKLPAGRGRTAASEFPLQRRNSVQPRIQLRERQRNNPEPFCEQLHATAALKSPYSVHLPATSCMNQSGTRHGRRVSLWIKPSCVMPVLSSSPFSL